ncbi:Glycosyl transferase family 2 [Yoonia litorea]|uniref:Glycosyl transferase family 2 n=2 Tax=Yoonia litorea TaxID=1123755 RepID=A0A1I6M447_9RHOB|nr:Glycosyl transferase family 2 [Yoonia litorea]
MRVLLISTMRNEAPFILEWLAYHQHIGVTDFLIYSNDCDDGTDLMLDRLQALGHLTHERNHSGGKKSVQWRALTKAFRHPLRRSADWIYVADVDEFLNIHAGDGQISDLMAACPDADGFAISWRMFGNAGVRGFEDRPIMAQFTQAAPETLVWPWRSVQYKSLFKNQNVYERLGVHRPKLADGETSPHWVDGNGDIDRSAASTYQFSQSPRYGLAQINHYALGSIESFLVKQARGKPNHDTDPIDLSYWIERNFASEVDMRILRHGAAVDARRSKLMSDPEVAELHDASVRWRIRKASELIEKQESFDLYSTLLQTPSTRPLPLADQEALLNQLVMLRRKARRDKARESGKTANGA